MKLFTGLLKVISSGWNLLVRLWGTMMRTQLLLGQSLVPLHYLALKRVYYNKTHLPICITLSLVYIFEIRNTTFLKKLMAFSVLGQEIIRKSVRRQTYCCIALINNLNGKETS